MGAGVVSILLDLIAGGSSIVLLVSWLVGIAPVGLGFAAPMATEQGQSLKPGRIWLDWASQLYDRQHFQTSLILSDSMDRMTGT